MAMSTIEAVSERLDGLEQENRRLRGLAMALLAGAIGIGAVAIFPRDRGGRKIEAQQLVIRDKEGRLRGSFGIDRDGLPSLKLYDHRGLEQVMLGVQSDDFSLLSLSDHGAMRALLDTSAGGYTSLRLFDPAQAEKAALILKPDSTVDLRLTNAHHSLRMGIAPDGRMTVPGADSGSSEVERFVPATNTSDLSRDFPAAVLVTPNAAQVPSPSPRVEGPHDTGIERAERHSTHGMAH
jgi:hypothetical protein